MWNNSIVPIIIISYVYIPPFKAQLSKNSNSVSDMSYSYFVWAVWKSCYNEEKMYSFPEDSELY